MPVETICMDHAAPERGHPWVQARCFHRLPGEIADGQSVGLVDSKGDFLGCGIFDRTDPSALWRRYSRAESVPFDANYVSGAVAGALERRSDEACQRVVSSDADYVPGVIVELFGDVVWVSLETTAARAHADLIVEVLNEVVNPVECVIDQGEGPKTASGQGLKGRWVEVDDLLYRIDLLNAKKPRFYLDQREQHALVGSLCEGRTVLDLFSHNGAFALQALRSGASRAVAVDLEENYVKAVGANAQRNGLQLEALAAEASDYLQGVEAGEFEAVVMDPPCGYFGGSSQTKALHRMAFANLPSGGLLATYCRDLSQADFEALVAEAAGEVGREARIFARTSQPFDFPMLLNFPESQTLKGLILQVE